VRIASIQLALADRPKGQNVEHALSMVDRVPPADLVLLPEIWPCGFFAFDRYAADSEPLDGPTVNAFRQKARERRCHILMGSLVERDADGLFNTTVFIGPAGEIVARYRKIHLFGYQSDETKLLTPGKEIVVTDTAREPGIPGLLQLRRRKRRQTLRRPQHDRGPLGKGAGRRRRRRGDRHG
jgi:predicted amidohydrolase